jgi:putative transposase
LYAKVARQQSDFHHQESAKLLTAAGAVCTETLHVQRITKRPKPKQDATTGQYQPNRAAAKAELNTAIGVGGIMTPVAVETHLRF